MSTVLHVSRTFYGGDKERFPECICAEQPCTYVVPDVDCPQHGPRFGKSFRAGHAEQNCPARQR